MGLLVLLLGTTAPHHPPGGGDLFAASQPSTPHAYGLDKQFASGGSVPSGRDPSGKTLGQSPTPNLGMEAESDPLEEVPRDPHASRIDLDRLSVEPARVYRRGPFRSIQVNVDAEGNNIRGDAANEPSIAINPKNPSQIVIGWRQFDSVTSDFREAGTSHSSDAGATWAAEKIIDEGVFRSDPVLGADADGTFHYLSLTTSGNRYLTDLFRSHDGGATWLPAVDAQGGDKQWMVVDTTDGPGRGNLYENWNAQFNCCGFRLDFTRSLDHGDSFEPARSIPNPQMRWGTLDVGDDGTLYLAGVINTRAMEIGHVFARSTNAWKAGEMPMFDRFQKLYLGGETKAGSRVNPIGIVGQVWIAVDRSPTTRRGNLYMLATIALPADDDNDLDVVFVRSEDGGVTWSAPKRLHDDPPELGAKQWFGTMSVAPNGRIDVIWNDTRHDIGLVNSEVFFTFSLDGGATWSPNHPVTPQFNPTLGYPHNEKIGDYYQMLSDDTGASLAYAATFNGEQDVYFLRIPVDCNHNGVEDACEISCTQPDEHCQVAGCGTGSDRNDNGVLDACEKQPLIANAGPDQTVECAFPGGASVTLDGSASSDPGGDALSYAWTDEQGRSLGAGAKLTVPLPLGSHTLTLEIGDPAGDTASDTVQVTVRDTLPPVVECVAAATGGASGATGSSGSASGTGATGGTGAAGARSAAPEAGFYILTARDACDAAPSIRVSDTGGDGPFGPFASGTPLKITKTPGGKAGFVPLGSPSGGLGPGIPHLHLPSDPEFQATDASANSARVRCHLP